MIVGRSMACMTAWRTFTSSQSPALHVEADVVDDVAVALDHPEAVVALEGLGVVGLDEGELDLAGLERRDRRGGVGEVAVDERVDLRPAAAIVVEGGELDVLVADVAART